MIEMGMGEEDVRGVGVRGLDVGEGVGGVEGVELKAEVGDVDFKVGVAVVKDLDGMGLLWGGII